MPCRTTGGCHIALLGGHFLHEVLGFFHGTHICAHSHFYNPGKAQFLHSGNEFAGSGMFAELANKRRGYNGDDSVTLHNRLNHLENLTLVNDRAKGAADQALTTGYALILIAKWCS